MWSAVLNWFLGSRVGKALAAVFGVAILLIGAYFKGRSEAKASLKAKANEKSLENLRNRSKVDEENAAKTPSARRDELGRWVRDD